MQPAECDCAYKGSSDWQGAVCQDGEFRGRWCLWVLNELLGPVDQGGDRNNVHVRLHMRRPTALLPLTFSPSCFIEVGGVSARSGGSICKSEGGIFR